MSHANKGMGNAQSTLQQQAALQKEQIMQEESLNKQFHECYSNGFSDGMISVQLKLDAAKSDTLLMCAASAIVTFLIVSATFALRN